jgi:hypothetical protein
VLLTIKSVDFFLPDGLDDGDSSSYMSRLLDRLYETGSYVCFGLSELTWPYYTSL